ncbi:hypothetical protein CO112_03055 [Candidatus Dojkabacteria bacterium CG_4_9_14_3_um_filter_150_Dojkabacteria_WS6_41_13]|nr:MAG: hypothetical protein CO112_03055 [Candidatus Dojkabacteria bacterium CG_4_9_14_3_um_filter_150_Dojkabacteria_WS6_41_13]
MDQLAKTIVIINKSLIDYAKLRTLLEGGATCIAVKGEEVDTAAMDKIKEYVSSYSESVPLLLDFEGPVVRLNSFDSPIKLRKGAKITIGGTPTDALYPISYPQLNRVIKTGQRVILEDNSGELVVEDVVNGNIELKATEAAILSSGCRLVLPEMNIMSEVLTETEKVILRHAMVTGWDFVTSFSLQDVESIARFREFTKGSAVKILVKIGTKQGVKKIAKLLEYVEGLVFDGVRISTEIPLDEIETVQQTVLENSISTGKLGIVMLPQVKGNIDKSDIIRAVFASADAMMFNCSSGNEVEIVKAISLINTIAQEVEHQVIPKVIHVRALDASISADALTKAAGSLCIEMSKDIDKVLVVSKTGLTARLLSRYHIPQPIFAFVSRWSYVRTTCVTRGIVKVYLQDSSQTDRDTAVQQILDRAKAEGIIKVSERILLICRTPIDGDHYFPNVFEVIEVK